MEFNRFRNRGTSRSGNAFSALVLLAVWSKGLIVAGYDPKLWRRDIYGNLIYFHDHGNVHSTYGWEVDHIKPVALGGSDDLFNLQPLQWLSNRTKSDRY